MKWLRCIFRRHKYVELSRYLMMTGEDHVFYRCLVCGKQKEEYTLDTYLGQTAAKPYGEWSRDRGERA